MSSSTTTSSRTSSTGWPTSPLRPRRGTSSITCSRTWPRRRTRRTAYQAPWQVALAGFLIGLESQPPDIYRRIVPALSKHYGWPEGSREVRFFATHIGADTIHSQRGFEIVERHCDTGALQAEAVQAVRIASRKRWNHMNGIYWHALHGRDDDSPPFP